MNNLKHKEIEFFVGCKTFSFAQLTSGEAPEFAELELSYTLQGLEKKITDGSEDEELGDALPIWFFAKYLTLEHVAEDANGDQGVYFSVKTDCIQKNIDSLVWLMADMENAKDRKALLNIISLLCSMRDRVEYIR